MSTNNYVPETSHDTPPLAPPKKEQTTQVSNSDRHKINYMTVKEAKTKFCPFKVKGNACVANSCMGWRWWDNHVDAHGYCGLGGVVQNEIKEYLR
jgi:hypothetical protein